MDCILLDCKALFLRYISITVNYLNLVFKQALFLRYISKIYKHNSKLF